MKDKIETIEDLVQDISFRHWVLKFHPEDVEKWNTWITLNPAKLDMVEEAANLVQVLEGQRKQISEERIERKWNELLQEMKVQPKPQDKERKRSFWQSYYFVSAGAAAALILLFVMLWLFIPSSFISDSQITYQTSKGEILHIYLPDSSKVVLHTESKLIIDKHWNKGEDRIVEVFGEAYFEVKQLADSTHFKVINQDVVVDVLGTTFMVNGRASNTEVILTSGKVRLTHEQQNDTIFMSPGEVATYAITDKAFTKRKIQDINKYLDWTQQKFIFDNTSLNEVGEMIEKFYGINIQIQDDELAKNRLSGKVPVDEDFEFILEIIELSFSSLKIDRIGDSSIVIRSK